MNLKCLILWLLVAYGLCLIPSSSFDWVKALLASDSGESLPGNSVNLLEWMAHFILLAGVAYHLVPLFASIPWLFRLVGALVVVCLIALSIEGLQGLLPPAFHRGPSCSDVWASLVGGAIGAVAALRFKRVPLEPVLRS